jgi:hypothetical protein
MVNTGFDLDRIAGLNDGSRICNPLEFAPGTYVQRTSLAPD